MSQALIKLTPSRIYLASPYSHPEISIRVERYQAACKAAANLMRAGGLVFSPIAHSHPLAGFSLPSDFGYWRNWRLSFLDRWATGLYILKLPGWNESAGIAAEWDCANKKRLPVAFLEASFANQQTNTREV